MKVKVCCIDCKFHEAVSDPSQVGVKVIYCHLDPPMPVMQEGRRGEVQISGIFPPVAPSNWCGRGEKEIITQ